MTGETKIDTINSKEKEEEEAKVEIWKYGLGFTAMAVVKCAIELGIADVLENRDNPMPLPELASELGCSSSSLYRIMRFLIHRKIFKEKPISETSAGYVQTPLSRLLTRQGEHSMADLVLFESTQVMLTPWHGLSQSASVSVNGDSPFKAAHGVDIWGCTAANPAFGKLLDSAMACVARTAVPAAIKGCPEVFEGLSSLVDVGGGDGTTIGLIVEACPWIKGINFDFPHVVSVAPERNGVEHVGGNMFDHVPKADAVYLMNVLHDWADEECIHILRKCREAVPQNTGKVIIMDAVMEREEEHEYKDVGLMLDMVMMAHTNNGKERTLSEWSDVLHKAGFTRHAVKHIRSYRSIIQAYP